MDVLQECKSSTAYAGSHKMESNLHNEGLDAALDKLKSELVALREQDIQLLRQLILINDSIRRLKRTRCSGYRDRTSSCGALGGSPGLQSARGATPSTSSLACGAPYDSPPWLGGARGGEGAGDVLPGGADSRGMRFWRQVSEPRVIGASSLSRGRLGSATLLSMSSSFSETIDDADEDGSDAYDSGSSDVQPRTTSPYTLSSTPPSCLLLPPTPPALAASQTLPPLGSGGRQEAEAGQDRSSTYGDILRRNVRLWKWSVTRDWETGLVVEGPCVL